MGATRASEAEFIAEHDAIERADRERERESDLRLEGTINGVLQQFQVFENTCKLMARASLLSAGYHQHARGEWRRRRGRSKSQ